MSEYNYENRGNLAKILKGATAEIKQRGWIAEGWNKDIDFDGRIGEIDFEYKLGTSDDHIALNLEGEDYSVGFPPEFVEIYKKETK